MELSDVTDLHALEIFTQNFTGCALKKEAQNTVFSDGNFCSPIMLIGEAPGAQEDETGRPFVGRSGQLLRTLFADARASVENGQLYITNMLFWRPPNNRPPTKAELASTLPIVLRHIELVQPRVLVLVGNTPAQTLLGSKIGVTKLRGARQVLSDFPKSPLLEIALNDIKIFPVLHPAYLLRNRTLVDTARADIAMIVAAA